MEEEFNQYVLKRFPTNEKRGTSGVIHIELGRKIKDCLRNPSLFSANFRHYVIKKKFRVFDLPSLGLKDVLVVPKAEGKTVLYFCVLYAI